MSRVLSIAICWLLLFSLINPCWADLTEHRSQLENIRARIDRAETALQNKKQSEINVSRELALIKKVLGQIARRIDVYKTDLKKLQGKIKRQEKNIKDSQKNVKLIGLKLEKRLIALYKEGEAGSLKILFSADSPT